MSESLSSPGAEHKITKLEEDHEALVINGVLLEAHILTSPIERASVARTIGIAVSKAAIKSHGDLAKMANDALEKAPEGVFGHFAFRFKIESLKV
jgi:hypothetical protein